MYSPTTPDTSSFMLFYDWRLHFFCFLNVLFTVELFVFLWEVTSQKKKEVPSPYVGVHFDVTCCTFFWSGVKSQKKRHRAQFMYSKLHAADKLVSVFLGFCHILRHRVICFMAPDNGRHSCMDAGDTSVVGGQRLGPKNTRPLVLLLTVASHRAVLSMPASEQQAGHSIPPFLWMHMDLGFHTQTHTVYAN